MTDLGYIRSSVGDPESVVEEQRRLLDESAYGPSQFVIDRGDQPGYRKASLSSLVSGDVLVVTSGDRLAHNVDRMLVIEAALYNLGVGLVLLSFNGSVLDFRTEEAKPVLAMLTEIANWEYQGLRERQAAGIASARQDGRYRGRKAVIRPDEVRERLQRGERPSAVARNLGIARSSVYRVAADVAPRGLSVFGG